MRICPHCETPTLDRICSYDGYQTVDAALYMEPEHDPFVGKAFQERYRIEERLAIGGMGTVYRASQVAVGRPVAIKILRQEVVHDLRVVARFQQEALAVAGLHHPNTVRIFDFGQSAEGHLFLVMEYLEGESLGDLIDNEAPLDSARVVRIGGQILDALAEAHSNGIIHRDLKPDNLFVTRVGLQPDFIKVLDFGIAKLDRGEARKRQLTQTGIVVGSPGYMAPEQVQSLPLTAQVDIYAVGAVMYEMLTGTPVFSGESAFEIAMKQVNEEPAPPVVNGKILRGPVVDCVMSFLAKEPDQRPAGSAEALRRLQDCISDEDGAGQVNHILPVRTSQPSMLSADVREGGRPRRSTSVFFSPGSGLNSFAGHRLWLALVIVAVGILGFTAFHFLSGPGGTTPSSPDETAQIEKSVVEKEKPQGEIAAKAKAAVKTRLPGEAIANVAKPAAKKSDSPLRGSDAAAKANVVQPVKASDGSSYPDGVMVFESSDQVAPGMDWVQLKTRPTGTKIYLNFGRGNRPLIGKNSVVVAWPQGTRRPKVRFKKKRYESYGFQVPRTWVGMARTVTLEWDDTQ
jgi:serine/threonine protein kinase